MASVASEVPVERIVLERVDMHLTRLVEKNPITLQSPHVWARELANEADRIALTLSGWMIGNKFPDRSEFAEFSYPAGWWQMLKSQYAPKWFLERWPVKNVEHRFECAHYRYHICPHWAEDFSRDKMPHIAYLADRPELYKRNTQEAVNGRRSNE